MKNILFIANPSSIHDQKWMGYIANQSSFFKVFVCSEMNIDISQETVAHLELNGINYLPPIESFSVSKPVSLLQSVLKLRQYIKQYKIDLIHVLFASPFALWLNFIGKPSIITTRGSDILIVIPNLLKELGLKRYYFKCLYSLFKRAFEKAEAVTGTSRTQLEKITASFKPKSLHLIRTGVEVIRINELNPLDFLPENLKNKALIFSPRFMSRIYDIELQIKALEFLSKETLASHTFLFVKGKSYEQDYFNKHVESLENLKQQRALDYIIVDYLSQEQMWAVLKVAKLCIMTPLSDGTPNSALEAMSAKCPLIIPNLNYDQDLFENTCMILEEREVKDLANLMEKALIEYPPELLENAYLQTLKAGNRKVEMERLVQIYKQILKLN